MCMYNIYCIKILSKNIKQYGELYIIITWFIFQIELKVKLYTLGLNRKN